MISSSPTHPKESTRMIRLIHVLFPKQRSCMYYNRCTLAEGTRCRPTTNETTEQTKFKSATDRNTRSSSTLSTVGLRQAPVPYRGNSRGSVGKRGWPMSGDVVNATSSSGMHVGTGNAAVSYLTTPFDFVQIFRTRILESLGYRVELFAWSYV